MKILHYPRLDTVITVEETLKNMNKHPIKKELWQSLPKKIQYQTFSLIIDYLKKSGKIIEDRRKLIWIFNPDLVKKSVEIKF
jgi:hypothetical protein